MNQLSTTESGTGAADATISRWLGIYAQLTKARLSVLVLWTTAVGYLLATQWSLSVDAARFIFTVVGTALAAGCANTLNQVLEIDRDARMPRTQDRPLPRGVVSVRHSVAVALALGVSGVVILALGANVFAATLAALTIVVYVAIYTPLKVHSSLNTLVGAICGAIPPMIGWVAATGRLDGGAWALGGLLFVWQLPHFLALAWLYRDDYARGDFAMLPRFDATGRQTAQIVVLTSLMLIPLSLSVTLLGLAGWIFTIGAVVLGVWMTGRALRMLRARTDTNARGVFVASLVYLSMVLLLLVLDRGPITPELPTHRLAAAETF